MTQKLWTSVDSYIQDLFVPRDPVLQAAEASVAEAMLPPISVTANEGKFLMLMARICGARRILEIGALAGYSTLWLARGLPSDGRLLSLEIDPRHAAVAQANIERAGLSKQVEIRIGDARASLAALAAEPCEPFDLIFIDADKESYPDYLALSLRLARPGTVLIADNVIRDGDILDSAHEDPRVQGTRRFNALLAAEPRVTATVIQTVGKKGHDGMAIAIVNQ